MTIVVPEQRVSTSRRHDLEELAAALLDPDKQYMLQRQIVRAVSPPSEIAPELTDAVSDVLTAFAYAKSSPARAARLVGDRMSALGIWHARRGWDEARLWKAFDRAGSALLTNLGTALGSTHAGEAVPRLRVALTHLVRILHQQAHAAWAQTHRNMAMSDDERNDAVRTELFGSGSDLYELLELSGFDPDAEFVVVVSVEAPLPPRVRGHRDAIAGEDVREVVASAAGAEKLVKRLSTQVVVGPPVRLDRVPDSLDMARRGAALLRESLTNDDRTIVPCRDLLSLLVVQGNRVLAELLVEKRLGPLLELGRDRRLHLGTLLLDSLERGLPLAQLAHALGIPPQTAHSRMQILRKLFGDDLDDPTARLELTLALRTALPEWARESRRRRRRGSASR